MIRKASAGGRSFLRRHPVAEREATRAKARQAHQGWEAKGRPGRELAVALVPEADPAEVAVQAGRAAEREVAAAADQAVNKRV